MLAIQLRQSVHGLPIGIVNARLLGLRPFLCFDRSISCSLLFSDFRMTMESFEPIIRFERPPDPLCRFSHVLDTAKRKLFCHAPRPVPGAAALEKFFLSFGAKIGRAHV